MRLNACVIPAIIATAVIAAVPAFAVTKNYTLDVARVAEIAASLPEKPAGPGKPASDRAFWDVVKNEPYIQNAISSAAELKDKPLPDLPDDLFLEYSRNGNRRNFERVALERRTRLTPLVLAECATNTGEFMPAITALIKAYCAERTWVLPAHDRHLKNFNDEQITIDLASSSRAWNLAMADYLIGDKLDTPTRETLRREMDRRVIAPFQAMIRNERPHDRWFAMKNNWNSVCFAGCTGAGLIRLDSAEERAELITAAEHYSQVFLESFSADGYCSEGVGYWDYGYGRFALMAENFRQATDSKVDLFAMEGAAAPAAYGPRITIINSVIPAFSDCLVNAKPSIWLLQMLNDVYGWDHPAYDRDNGFVVPSSHLYVAMLMQAWRTSEREPIAGVNISGAAGLRTIFEDGGVFILRPDDAEVTPFAVAFKGGNNAELHNHNDIGAYTVVAGDKPVLLDPGRENYTRRTFTGQRYESKLLNSYGHPVPLVGGKLQSQGEQAKGVVTAADHSDTTDSVTIDMTSAYDVPSLKKLTRRFDYDRTGGGSLVVTDVVEFSEPTTFETALISLDAFDHYAEQGRVIARMGEYAVQADVVSSVPYRFSADSIKEDAPVEPHRLAIKLSEPITSATVSVRIRPLKN